MSADAGWDYLIVGSGAGGSAAAYKLVGAGRRVLLLEKGARLPEDGTTTDPEVVLGARRFMSSEVWTGLRGVHFAPEEHFNLGGKTRWYGAALLRFRASDFEADSGRRLLPWPFAHAELNPHYDEAEELLGDRTFAPELGLLRIASRLSASGWRSQPLALGLSPDILQYPDSAIRFDGFALPGGLKDDAQSRLLDRIAGQQNLAIETGAEVVALLPAPGDPLRISGVRLRDGREFVAGVTLLAAGALHSPRLLQDYVDRQSLGAQLPGAAQIGRNFKRHLLTAVMSFSLRKKTDRLQKTLLITHPDHPDSSVQPLGGWIDSEMVRLVMPRWLPRALVNLFATRVYGFFLQTEDGSHPDNRVRIGAAGEPVLEYDPQLLPQYAGHRGFVRAFMRALLRAGRLPFEKDVDLTGTAHACGTLLMGSDPHTSVVDADGKVHGMTGLYVVDGSVLPRSSCMNPALTIYAWALRVAGRLLADVTQSPSTPAAS